MIKRLINRVAELKQAYFNWLVFLLAFFLPSQLGKHFFFPFSYVAGIRTDYLAPTLFLTDVLAAFLIVPLLLGRKSFFPRKITISVLLLLVGIIFSVAPLLSFYKEIKYLEVVLLGASLFSVLQRKKQRVFFFSLGLMFSAILELIVALLQFINKRSLQGVFYFFGERAFSLSTPGIAKASYHGIEFLRPYATFSHPNSLAGFYLLVYVFYFFYKKNLPRRVRLPILFISSLLILLSFSKVAVGVFILVNLLSLISRRSDDSCHICFLSRCVGFLTVGYLFFAFKTDPLTISNRLTLVKRAVQIVIAHPITGVGAGAYVIAQSAFSFSVWYLFNQPVHNIFLLVLAEHGLLVPLALLFLFRHQAIRFLKKYPYIALVIGITGLFDHYFLTLQQNLLLIGVVLGGL